jgi:hypothetical protein
MMSHVMSLGIRSERVGVRRHSVLSGIVRISRCASFFLAFSVVCRPELTHPRCTPALQVITCASMETRLVSLQVLVLAYV